MARIINRSRYIRMIVSHKKFEGTVHPDLDQQTKWFNEFRLEPIRLGQMCEQYPSLQNSWNEFKLVYELCRSQDDINRQIS